MVTYFPNIEQQKEKAKTDCHYRWLEVLFPPYLKLFSLTSTTLLMRKEDYYLGPALFNTLSLPGALGLLPRQDRLPGRAGQRSARAVHEGFIWKRKQGKHLLK